MRGRQIGLLAGSKYNFIKADTNNLDTPYDYTSVMHYSTAVLFGEDTITPVLDPSVEVGQQHGVSSIDILRINKLTRTRTRDRPSRIHRGDLLLIVIVVQTVQLIGSASPFQPDPTRDQIHARPGPQPRRMSDVRPGQSEERYPISRSSLYPGFRCSASRPWSRETDERKLWR
ncbi:hypothetical protein CRUP_008590 [Coryphaenoides rupestris]|nr:hypothetical protein CRUP_008590 [Coryphaenoides rupestris]